MNAPLAVNAAAASHPPIAAELWQDLVEKDDRTSPEEYPEMALISFDELAGYIAEAQSGLLAALKALVPADFDEHPGDFMPEWHAARAAIAEAEGR